MTKKRSSKPPSKFHPRPEPTLDEIRERCLEVQSEWTPEVRLARMSPALRPFIGTADGRMLPVAAADYEAHLETREAYRCHE